MKEAAGELNLTVITVVAIAAIAAILWANWGTISDSITNAWGNQTENCPPGQVPDGSGGCH